MKVTPEFIRENITLKEGQYPCRKQTVYCCIVSACGKKTVFGSNWGTVEVDECPRADLPSGEGYEMCKNVCRQKFHAETDAIAKAKKLKTFQLKGATLFVLGHTHMCDNCLAEARRAGIVKATCLDSKKQYHFDPM